MCGFAGEIVFGAGRANLELARRMASQLTHRGPDQEGSFLSPDGRCAIGFRRLAVIDPAGSLQPMSLPDGSLTVAFNGEIYNFQDLRRQLQQDGCPLVTHGDTEVLLHLYARHGEGMLDRLEGMFALALYDARNGRLLLARDRLGEKPLWIAHLGDRVLFASQAKALLEHPQVVRSVNNDVIVTYSQLGYVPSPSSIWRGLEKLPPAHFVSIDQGMQKPVRYWRPEVTQPPASEARQVEQVYHSVIQAVQKRLVSDVPLGALLSGGIDSSIVVALMAKAAGRTGGVRTFTAGFEEELFDERPAAAAVAAHCCTEHTELLVRPQLEGLVDRIVAMYDEPFGDSSAVATHLVCQAAREHVTVALVGDGGDEIFGGYDRYRAMHLAETMRPPAFLGVKVAAALASLVAPQEERSRLRRLVRFSKGLSQPPALQYFLYRSLFEQEQLSRLFTPEFAAQVSLTAGRDWFAELYEAEDWPDEVTRAQNHDLLTYLPDDLLVKSDIASMTCSLELRAPFLAHELVPIGLSLPPQMKFRGRLNKYALRQAFGGLLPEGILARRKQGFGIPLGDWLRRELAATVRERLLDRSFLDRGIFQPLAIRGLVNDHLEGRDDHRHRLWSLLILATWLAKHA